MPEKGFGVRFKSYHSTLDDFTDEEIENSVVRNRRKELKFSDIDLYPDKASSPVEFHLEALSEPDVSLSTHPAPIRPTPE